MSRRVVCPLCLSEKVRIVYEASNLLVCACDYCRAQFTVSPGWRDDEPPLFEAAAPSDSRPRQAARC